MNGFLTKVVNQTSPVPLTTRTSSLTAGFNSGTNRTDELSQMEDVSTLFSIIDLIATSVASVDWHLYRKANTPNPEQDREEVFQHPALVVWNRPNPFYTQDEFIEAITQHYELTGEFWWVLESRSAGPFSGLTDIWPIRPDRMSPVKHPRDFISGYVYQLGSDEIPLSTDEVVYDKRQNPKDPWRGLSPIQSLMIDIRGERAASQWNTIFFRNGAEPGGVVELGLDRVLDDTEFEKLNQHWRSQHKGVNNAHRVAIMEMGKWVDKSYSHKDMEFQGLRQFNAEKMMEAYRVSKAMLGRVEDVNRSNNEAQWDIFNRQIRIPRLERLKKVLNQKLLPHFGPRENEMFEFDYDDPSEENSSDVRLSQRSNVLNARALIEVGFDPTETLQAFDLPELKYVGPPEDKAASKPSRQGTTEETEPDSPPGPGQEPEEDAE